MTHRPTTTKNATRFEENVLRLASAFRAASRSISDHGTDEHLKLHGVFTAEVPALPLLDLADIDIDTGHVGFRGKADNFFGAQSLLPTQREMNFSI